MGAVRIETESGAAEAELEGDAAPARFLLVLTHGAGGSARRRTCWPPATPG